MPGYVRGRFHQRPAAIWRGRIYGPLLSEAHGSMSDQQFPYEKSPWNSPHGVRWLDALERTGVEGVRIRLGQNDCGSAGALAIGKELTVTRGFAEEWLTWRAARAAEREQSFRSRHLLDPLGRDGRIYSGRRRRGRLDLNGLAEMVID
jgi:hypothetical protein